MKTQCPHCRMKQDFASEKIGCSVYCKHCRQPFLVPKNTRKIAKRNTVFIIWGALLAVIILVMSFCIKQPDKGLDFENELRSGNIGRIALCISKGSEVNTPLPEGRFPLHFVIQDNNIANSFAVVQYLVSRGARIDTRNNKGKTSLHLASESDRFDIVEYLVSKGAQLNIQDNQGRTPLHLAAWMSRFHIVKHLVSKGAKIDIQDHEGKTALYLAAELNAYDVVEYNGIAIVKYLVSEGADLNAKNKNGQIPLYAVAHNGDLELFKFMVSQGADWKVRDNNGVSVLEYCKK